MVTNVRVLLLTNEQDVSADWVVRELRHRAVSYLRLNTERLTRAGVFGNPGRGQWSIRRHDGTHAVLNDVRGIWYRRPDPPIDRLDDVSPGERELINGQWRSLVDGLCALPGVRLVNSPWANQRAETKTYQLRLAADLGFRVPDTVVTNERSVAADFLDANMGNVIVKGLDAPLIEGDQPRFVYAQRLDRSVLARMGEVDLTPLIFQAAVHPKTDIRVTVIGDRVFAAETTVPTHVVDWRSVQPRPVFGSHALAAATAERCRRLVREMGLVFGAIDLGLNRDGYHFFEINPNGEWGWLQKTLGFPIATAIAEELAR